MKIVWMISLLTIQAAWAMKEPLINYTSAKHSNIVQRINIKIDLEFASTYHLEEKKAQLTLLTNPKPYNFAKLGRVYQFGTDILVLNQDKNFNLYYSVVKLDSDHTDMLLVKNACSTIINKVVPQVVEEEMSFLKASEETIYHVKEGFLKEFLSYLPSDD